MRRVAGVGAWRAPPPVRSPGGSPAEAGFDPSHPSRQQNQEEGFGQSRPTFHQPSPGLFVQCPLGRVRWPKCATWPFNEERFAEMEHMAGEPSASISRGSIWRGSIGWLWGVLRLRIISRWGDGANPAAVRVLARHRGPRRSHDDRRPRGGRHGHNLLPRLYRHPGIAPRRQAPTDPSNEPLE